MPQSRPGARDPHPAPGTGIHAGTGALPRVAPPAPPRPRPDPNPLRILLGFAGLASASAITTALLPSIVPAADATVSAAAGVTDPATGGAALGPQPSVRHVVRYVVLEPGQTAPPDSAVIVQPTPTPRVTVVTKTRQSGTP